MGRKKKNIIKIEERIQKLFELGSEEFRRKWKDDPIGFLEKHCGRKYPRKIKKFFEAIYNCAKEGKNGRFGLKSNRGGGKTTSCADIAACVYLFLFFDAFIMGGAEAQAKNAYNYAAQVLQIDERLDDFHEEILKTLCRSNRGNWLRFAASSTKQARGPHCGDPHKEMDNDMQSHGGITFIDEECETDDDVVTAVKYTINTARPGILVRCSTLHKVTGSFAEMCEDPGAVGMILHEWDCFDTAEKCMRDCKKCRYEFAGRKRAGFEEWNLKHPEWKHEKGYCEGKAKQGDGWRTIESIEESFLGASNLGEFEVEEMGWRPAAGGKVLDPVLLDLSLRGRATYIPGMPTMQTIDWGFSGWAVIHVLQQQKNNDIVFLKTEYYHRERDDIIYKRAEAFRDIYNAWLVCADSEGKYQNENLKFRGFEVEEVAFNKYKEYGAGWLKGLLEQGRLWIQGEIRQTGTDTDEHKQRRWFVDWGTERFFNEMLGWKRDKNGKIVKGKDHGPDSALCGSVRWGEGIDWKVTYASSGRREIMDVAGIK